MSVGPPREKGLHDFVDAVASFLPYVLCLLAAIALMVSAFDISIVAGGWYFVFFIAAGAIMAVCGVLCLCFRKADTWNLLDDEMFAPVSFFIGALALCGVAVAILAWMVTWKPYWFSTGTAPSAYQTASYLSVCTFGAAVLSVAFGSFFIMIYGNAVMRKMRALEDKETDTEEGYSGTFNARHDDGVKSVFSAGSQRPEKVSHRGHQKHVRIQSSR